jgi:hypothetical protein
MDMPNSKNETKNAGTGHSPFNTGVEHSNYGVPANRLKGLACVYPSRFPKKLIIYFTV